MIVEVWTTTVDDGAGIYTSVFTSESEALESLAVNYDEDGELRALTDSGEIVEALTEHGGIVLYIDSHIVDANPPE